MTRKILWMVVSCLMALSLVMAACGPAAVEEEGEVVEKEVVEKEVPKYGGTLNIVTAREPRTSRSPVGGLGTRHFTHQSLWYGDWAKGPAGGYGTNEVDWNGSFTDIWDLNAGLIAESTKWTTDAEKNEGTLIYQIRQGIHFALNPDSEASRLVGGREVTADDVVFTLTTEVTHEWANLYSRTPVLRVAEITKSGPWEITIKVPLEALAPAIMRFGSSAFQVAPEVVEKYGDIGSNWEHSVGSGPFMLTDYIAGSVMTFTRNDNFWMKNPVGPGKGNQLPYVDVVQQLIIPDASTRQAAMRTGKVDQMAAVLLEDATLMRQTSPGLLDKESGMASSVSGNVAPIKMRTDKAPFNDVRVRRAMMMAIDYEAINQSLGYGIGEAYTYPFDPDAAYEPIYLRLDDPDCPESVKELYTYNPQKARQLLKEAGYPDGFKTHVILAAPDVDYYAIIKDMWAKVAIELELRVKESGVVNTMGRDKTYEAIISGGGLGPAAIFYIAPLLRGPGTTNLSMVDDPIINEELDEIAIVVLTDMYEGMVMFRELTKYILDQAYVIPNVAVPTYHMWWPWLKNYSGENSIGYGMMDSWAPYVWIDQELKKEMGY